MQRDREAGILAPAPVAAAADADAPKDSASTPGSRLPIFASLTEEEGSDVRAARAADQAELDPIASNFDPYMINGAKPNSAEVEFNSRECCGIQWPKCVVL